MPAMRLPLILSTGSFLKFRMKQLKMVGASSGFSACPTDNTYLAAGLRKEDIDNSNTSVFVGCFVKGLDTTLVGKLWIKF
jgi:hypothetical protein